MDDPYKFFDPDATTAEEEGLLQLLRARDRRQVISVRGFTTFSMAVQQGFERINYQAHLRVSDGAYFWIEHEHARRIGQAITHHLTYLGLEITTVQDGAFGLMVDTVPDGIHVTELVIAHKSADEVTVREAVDLARLLTRTSTRVFHLWAAEFLPGSLEAFQETILTLNNCMLEDADVCDITRPEPDDRIALPLLEPLLARNRRRYD